MVLVFFWLEEIVCVLIFGWMCCKLEMIIWLLVCKLEVMIYWLLMVLLVLILCSCMILFLFRMSVVVLFWVLWVMFFCGISNIFWWLFLFINVVMYMSGSKLLFGLGKIVCNVMEFVVLFIVGLENFSVLVWL